jgi:hypothetical protein
MTDFIVFNEKEGGLKKNVPLLPDCAMALKVFQFKINFNYPV